MLYIGLQQLEIEGKPAVILSKSGNHQQKTYFFVHK